MPDNNLEEEKKAAAELFKFLESDTSLLRQTVEESTNDLTLSSRMVSNNTLLSSEDFSRLPIKEEIRNALYQQGYEKPSVAQLNIVPRIVNGENIMFKSESGTGKTISFVIGTLGSVVVNGGIQILLITPTLELSRQNKDVFDRIGQSLGVRTFFAKKGERVSYVDAEILIGSPGALLNTLRALKTTQIRILIIDEADAVLDPDGMGSQTKRILEMVKFEQCLFFSATYSPSIKNIIMKYVKNVKDYVDTPNTKPDSINLYHIEIHHREEKMSTLMVLYELLVVGQSVIFVGTRRMAEILKVKFEADLSRVGILHGDMRVEEREQVANDFRHAKTKVLITTDVWSRGTDIPQVNLVINYDLPVHNNKIDLETYIHRVGRCGRFGRKGFVIDFVCGESDMAVIREISSRLASASKRTSLEALIEVTKDMLAVSKKIPESGSRDIGEDWAAD